MDRRATISRLTLLWIFLSCFSLCWAQFNAQELLEMCTGLNPLRKNYLHFFQNNTTNSTSILLESALVLYPCHH